MSIMNWNHWVITYNHSNRQITELKVNEDWISLNIRDYHEKRYKDGREESYVWTVWILFCLVQIFGCAYPINGTSSNVYIVHYRNDNSLYMASLRHADRPRVLHTWLRTLHGDHPSGSARHRSYLHHVVYKVMSNKLVDYNSQVSRLVKYILCNKQTEHRSITLYVYIYIYTHEYIYRYIHITSIISVNEIRFFPIKGSRFRANELSKGSKVVVSRGERIRYS